MKKPEPVLEKPAFRTNFAAAAASNAPITATAAATTTLPKIGAAAATAAAAMAGGPAGDAKIEKSATSDWGLSLKKPRQTARLKIAAGILLVFSAVGGYAAYTRFAGKDLAEAGAEDAADNGAEVARSDENGAPDADAELTGGADPFDERPEVRATANSRAPANSEPRRVGNIPDAMPIASRNARRSGSKNNPLHDSLELDDATLDNADDADAPARDQSEPDPGDDASGPSLGETAGVPRRLPAAGRGDSNGSRSSAERDQSSGPRSSPRDREADPSDNLSDEKLGDYRVAGKRTAGKSKGGPGGTSISIVEAHDGLEDDEKFDSYVPQDVTTRRATSKTVVVRSTDEAPLAPETNADLVYSNAARGATSGIQRRSTPPAPPAIERSMSIPAAGRGTSRVSDPASDTYRVAPDDNFWKISRKHYGTARYFQALMRHNQERVPDPQKLRPGTQVLTPPAAVLEQRYPELIEKPASPTAPTGGSDGATTRPRFEKPFSTADANDRTARPDGEAAASGYFYSKTGEPLYRIGADDTLTGIAQRHLGRSSRWNEIYDKNQDVLKSPDNLTLGTVIRLPSDASRLSLVPDGERRR